MAFQAEAVGAAPVDGTVAGRILVGPDNRLHSLPVATLGGRGVLQGRHVEFLTVHREHLPDESTVIDGLLGDEDGNDAGSLAVEHGIVQEHRIAVGIHQFDSGNEFQVLTVDLEFFSALDALAFLFGITGNDGMAQSKVSAGDGLVIGRTDDELAAFGSNALRRIHADHFAADELEVGNGHVSREHNLGDIGKPVTVDGHRLSGDNLGREEGFDTQSHVGRRGVFLLDTGRESTCKDDRQSNIFDYLFHI